MRITVRALSVALVVLAAGCEGTVAAPTITPETAPAPELTSIAPGLTLAGGPDFEVRIYGHGFVPRSVVRWDGMPRLTRYLGADSLVVLVTATDISIPTIGNIDVSTPEPGGGTTRALPFQVRLPLEPPLFHEMVPDSAPAGSPDLVITVHGDRYDSLSTVVWNGLPLETTLVTQSTMTAVVPATLLAVPDVVPVQIARYYPRAQFTANSISRLFTVYEPPSP